MAKIDLFTQNTAIFYKKQASSVDYHPASVSFYPIDFMNRRLLGQKRVFLACFSAIFSSVALLRTRK
jgi:hypothetical protein